MTSSPSLPLTALLLTWNETANIGRTLAGLRWVSEIVVIDSGSTDGTLEVLAAHPNVRVLHREFDSFAAQCNFGLERISTEWVLSLDADYGVPEELARSMSTLLERADQENLAGFSLPFRYCIDGRPLRGSLLPPRTCLYRTLRGRYRDEGHGHRVVVQGEVAPLNLPLLHDDRKPLERWLDSQQKYLRIEAANLLSTPSHRLSWVDRLRKHTPLSPLAAFSFCLLLRGGLLDGRTGLAYALQRTYAELLLLLMLHAERSRQATQTTQMCRLTTTGTSLERPS